MKITAKSTATNSTSSYCEVGQPSQVEWFPLVTTRINQHALSFEFPMAGVHCREFFADWQFHCIANCQGDVYGFRPDISVADQKKGLEYIAACSRDVREDKILREFSEFEIPSKDIEHFSGCMVHTIDIPETMHFIPIPDYCKAAPMAFSMWMLGMRYWCENPSAWGRHMKEGSLFPAAHDVNRMNGGSEGMIAQIYEALGLELFEKAWKYREEFFWKIPADLDGIDIGEGTHEALSPITHSAQLRLDRFPQALKYCQKEIKHMLDMRDTDPDEFDYEYGSIAHRYEVVQVLSLESARDFYEKYKIA